MNLIDIRPFPIEIAGLSFVQADATNLDGIQDNSIESISSLHAIEHFGLGRYGDKIDPYAWKKVLKSIQRVMCPSGMFYLGLPVGNEEKVCFNAHRIFNPNTIINTLNELELISFAYIHDFHVYETNPEDINGIQKSLGEYDCGLFVFRKREVQ